MKPKKKFSCCSRVTKKKNNETALVSVSLDTGNTESAK